MLFLALEQGIASFGAESGQWWLATPKYWVFPLQTLVLRRRTPFLLETLPFGPLAPGWIGVLGGLAILGIWIAPQAALVSLRESLVIRSVLPGSGGNHASLDDRRAIPALVVVVPLVEEIFWRGFLMRYLIKEDFQKVPFGTYAHLSFFRRRRIVHAGAQHGGLACRVLSPASFSMPVAVKTRSLFACVVAHAVANLGLVYIL